MFLSSRLAEIIRGDQREKPQEINIKDISYHTVPKGVSFRINNNTMKDNGTKPKEGRA